MESLMTGLDKVIDLKSAITKRLELLSVDQRDDISSDVLSILDDLVDNTTTLTPLYKIMAQIPDFYFRDCIEISDILVNVGKTIEVLQIINSMA
jgi:hypothetical protein